MCIKLISKGSDHILWVLKWSNFTKRNVRSEAAISGMVSVLTTWPQTNGMRPRKHSRLTALSHISVVSKKFHFHLILFCAYGLMFPNIQHLNSNRLSFTFWCSDHCIYCTWTGWPGIYHHYWNAWVIRISKIYHSLGASVTISLSLSLSSSFSLSLSLYLCSYFIFE